MRTKLGNVHLIPARERSKLCEQVIKQEGLDSWLSVAGGECQWDGGFIDFDEVSRTLAEFLNENLYKTEKVLRHPLTVVYVCGLDHFNKCPYVADLVHAKNLACAVIYRLNANEIEIKRLENQSDKVYYIPLTAERSTLVDISSTRIRQQHGTDSSDLEQFTYPSVCSYLKEKYPPK